MRALHDFRCTSCGCVFEEFLDTKLMETDCKDCGKKAEKTFERFGFRRHVEFPEGPWHGLPEEDGHAPEIRSRRQLREYIKRHSKDEFTESYAVYDDGYAGY